MPDGGRSLTAATATAQLPLTLIAHDRLSPRRQPDLVHQVAAIPHTLAGGRMEVPVKSMVPADASTKGNWAGPGTFEVAPGVYRIPLPLPTTACAR